MAIVKNISDEIGDIIRIETDVPVIGIVALNSFSDTTVGETATKYFTKEFRYSTDGGMNFSGWLDLTSINISGINVAAKDLFIIEYRYIRDGSDATGTLEFTSLNVSGDFQDLGYPVYQRNFFNDHFWVNDANVLNWALNVLEKLYKRGLMADYVTRREDEDNPIADTDFLAFFGTVTHFFAIIVYWARQFKNIPNNMLLLEDFVLRTLCLYAENDISAENLTYLFENYTEEFGKRGTLAITDKSDVSPNGELRRLVGYSEPEEFLMAHLEPHATGWCLGKSSPTFNYTRHCENMIKSYEYGYGFADISKYPITGNVSINSGVLELRANTADYHGIYLASGYEDYLIEVSDSVDYEIIIHLSKASAGNSLNFGMVGFDENMNQISFETLFDSSDSNLFFSSMDTYQYGLEYQIRGLVRSKKFEPSPYTADDFKLNIGYGYDLQFKHGIKYMMPMLYSYGVSGAGAYADVYDIKIRPMNFNFTLGKLGQKNNIYLLYKNSSARTGQWVYNQAVNKLLPYNSNLIDRSI